MVRRQFLLNFRKTGRFLNVLGLKDYKKNKDLNLKFDQFI